MKITIECSKCGSIVELMQREGVPWLNLRPDYNEADIKINNIEFNNLEIEEDMEVGEEVPAELRSIELRCRNCGHFVTLEF